MSVREAANKMEKGTRKYNERIHKESRYADTHKNLPFEFTKPQKNKPSNVLVVCEECGKDLHVTQDTVVVICGHCKHFNKTKGKK